METPYQKGFDTNYGVPIKIKTAIIYYGIPIIIGCIPSLSCTLPRCCRVLVALLKVWAALICCDRTFVLVVSKLRCLSLRGVCGVHVLSGESDVLHEGAKSC